MRNYGKKMKDLIGLTNNNLDNYGMKHVKIK